MFYRDEGLALFVHYPDLVARFADVRYEVDWKKFRSEFVRRGMFKGCFIYDPEKELDPHEMALMGFDVITEHVDIALTLKITHMAREEQIGHAVLFASDARYIPIVEEVRRTKTRVSVVSTPDGVDPNLLLAASQLLKVEEIKDLVATKKQ